MEGIMVKVFEGIFPLPKVVGIWTVVVMTSGGGGRVQGPLLWNPIWEYDTP
jgi:hypothetical protein